MLRRFSLLVLVVLAVSAAGATAARAAGGDVAFAGGTARQQSQVRAALTASAFDWGLLGRRITVHIAPGTDSYASPGQVWLDADLLDAGRFSWGVVQHEFAHQVDFLLLDDGSRATLTALLGGGPWCGEERATHDEFGCERFAETLAAAYWRSPDNVAHAFAAPAAFRATLEHALGLERSLASATPEPRR